MVENEKNENIIVMNRSRVNNAKEGRKSRRD
jgi:hypothetical protein